MVNVYGDYSQTGYNNPNAPAQQSPTSAQAMVVAAESVGYRGSYGSPANQRIAQDYYAQQQAQQQQPAAQPVQQQQVQQQQPAPDRSAFQMATEASRRGEVIDPYVLAKAREQGYLGSVNESPSIIHGAASRAAQSQTNPVSRGNIFPTDADAFTAMRAEFVGKGVTPRYSPEQGSVTQRFAFDEYGKVLKGGKFEPAYNNTDVPYNPKMGAGEYKYVGEYQYATGEIVSRYKEQNVNSFVDFSQQGAAGQKEIGVRSGGSPGSFYETNQPVKQTIGGMYPTGEFGLIKQPAATPLQERGVGQDAKDIFGIGATAAQGGTGGIQFAEPIITSGQKEWTPAERFWESASRWGAAEFGFIGASTDAAVGVAVGLVSFGQVKPPTFFADQNPNTDTLNTANANIENAVRVAGSPNDIANQRSYLDQLAVGNVSEGVYTGNLTQQQDLTTRRLELESLKAGNVKEGVWTNTPETLDVYNKKTESYNADLAVFNTKTEQGFSEYQEAYDKYSGSVNQFNAKQQGVTKAQEEAVQSGAYVYRNGQLVVNPDQQLPYGEFSKWGIGAKELMLSKLGYSENQLEAYSVQQAAKPATPFNMAEGFVLGFGKQIVTKPAETAAMVGAGAEIYVATGGIGLGIQGLAAPAATEAAVAGGGGAGAIPAAGWLSRGANLAMRVGENPVMKWGVPAFFIGQMEYQATEGFTQTPVKAAQSTGTMTAQFAPLVYGGIGAGLASKGFDVASTRLEEKPMIRQTYEGKIEYTQQPDIQVQSGVGGSIKYTQTTTIATQPSINLFGKEIAFPRIFNPVERGKPVTTTVELGYGDLGRLTEARLPGTETNPVVGVRTESLVLETFRGQEVAQGTGNVKVAEVRLPRSINEYLKMGEADAKLGATRTITLDTTAPLQEGYIRLYRGEDINRVGQTKIGDITVPHGVTNPNKGAFFTNDYAMAEEYAGTYSLRGKKGVVSYVDIPKSSVEQFNTGMDIGYGKNVNEYILPEDIATKRQILNSKFPQSVTVKLSPEEVSASLMADATKVTQPVTGYRELEVTVPAGTPIRDAFDWTINKEGGTEIPFNKITMEDYFGSMKVQQTGQNDYQVAVTRDVGEQGFMKGGSYDVTGSQVPETKIVAQLQEVSKGLKVGANEWGFAFDNRGNLIKTQSGGPDGFMRTPLEDAIGNIEGPGSLVHTHPPRNTGSLFSNLKEDFKSATNKEYLTDIIMELPLELRYGKVAEQIGTKIYELKGMEKYPSPSDTNTFGANKDLFTDPHAVTAEYIVTPQGVTIMREPIGGWERYKSLTYAQKGYMDGRTDPLYPRTMQGSEKLGAAGNDRIMGTFGISYDFIKTKDAYRAPGLTERITDSSAEMNAAYPVGVRGQLVDVVDRVILKDPNMEFIREQQINVEKPLSQSGSNLGRGSGGGSYGNVGSGRSSPVAQMQMPEQQQSVRPISQPATYRAEQPLMATPETVRSAPQSSAIPRSITEPAQGISQRSGLGQIIIPAQSQRSRQGIEPAFAMTPVQGQWIKPSSALDYARAFSLGSAIQSASRQDQAPDYARGILNAQDQFQSPLQDQRQDQLQLQRQVPQMPQPNLPFNEQPYKPIKQPGEPGLPPFGLPYSPSGGGYPTISKRRPRSFVETFHVGLDLAAQSAMGIRTPKGRRKKGRLIPKGLLTTKKKGKK